jgi:hypothetical protein
MNNNLELTELGFDLDDLTGEGKKRNRVNFAKIEQGASSFRILPSFNPANKKISHTWVTHWLTGPSGKKTQVQCTYYTEQYCPICERHKEIEEQIKRLGDSGDSDADVLEELKESEEALRRSKNVYMNALNANNELVVLRISATVEKLLGVLFKDAVEKKKFDPTNPKTGTWIEFTRNGTGQAAVKVDYKKIIKVVDGEEFEKRDHTPITDEQLDYLKTAATDIHSPEKVLVKTFSAKQLADFLRGIPLEQQEPISSKVRSGEAAPAARTTPANGSTGSAPQSESPSEKPASAVAPASGTQANLNVAAELERLRSLAGGGSK